MLQSIWSFALVAGLLTLTPGIDTALVLRTAAAHRRAAAFATALGICAGCLAWGIAAALGVSALLTASEVAFTLLRYVGAAYLVFLGVRMMVLAVRGDAPGEPEVSAVTHDRRRLGPFFRQGLLTNLLNPKVGAFYIALLPQFIPAGQPPALVGAVLALVHGVEGMLWFSTLILLVDRMARWLRRPNVRRGIDTTVGLVVVGFGVRLALARA